MKKSIAIWVGILFCALLLYTGAAAEKSGKCGDSVNWTLSDAGVLTITGSGEITSSPWTAEDTIDLVKEADIGKGITKLCNSAFKNCSELEKVTLPDTLTEIGAYAFAYTSALKEIAIPDSVKGIGSFAFGGYRSSDFMIHVSSSAAAEMISKSYQSFRMKGLKYSQMYLYDSNGERTGIEISQVDKDITAFTFPAGTTAIGSNAFYRCEELKSIVIPEGVTDIEWYAFAGCEALETVSLPTTLRSVEAYAFYSCASLKELVLPDQITDVDEDSFYSYNRLALIVKGGSQTEKTLSNAGIYYREKGMNYSICREFDDKGNKTGTELYYADDSMASFTIPDDITSIAANAFSGNKKLKSVTVPASLTQIGSNVFSRFGGYVYFKGKAPAFAEDAFTDASVVVVYPHDQDGWTDVTGKKYGARILLWQADNAGEQTDADKDASEELNPAETNNESGQDVTYNYASTVDSYLSVNDDGTMMRVEHAGENVIVEMYSAEMKLTWKKTLKLELPLWGGFYSGVKYNFLVEGQDNDAEDDSVEVVRVIRYSKNWHRIDSVSVFGHNTKNPFHAGSLRMTEADDFLYIHTCHRMYKSSDGLNHQANMSYQIYVPSMTITRENYLVSNDAYDYVSHSFDQHVITDGSDIIKVDQGDAYPRAVTLMKIADSASSPGYGQTTRVTLLKIAGEIGENYTGVSIGGLTASASRYIVAGTSVDQKTYNRYGQDNIFVASVPKNELENSKVSFRWITSYAENSGIHVATPQLVRIDGTKLLLLWTESKSNGSSYNRTGDKTLKYVFLKEDGSPSSDIYSADARLSDCKPVVRDGKVIWYVTADSGSVFFTIDPADPGNVQTNTRSSWVKLTAGWYYYDENGKMVTGWLTLDGGTFYYMNEQGIMVTGWQLIDGKYYLFDDNGVMAAEQWYKDEAGKKYYLGADGAAATGLAVTKDPQWNYNSETGNVETELIEKTHFFNEDGVMQTGWQLSGEDYYYFDEAGDMVASRWLREEREDGTVDYYYLGEDGTMQTGFVAVTESVYRYDAETDSYGWKDSNVWYYCDTDGKRVTGWKKAEDGKTYCFDDNGRMMASRWITEDGNTYYLGEDGVMATGTVEIDGKTYHFTAEGVYTESVEQDERGWISTDTGWTYIMEDGTTATDWLRIDDAWYCFDEDGVMRTGWYEENGFTYYLDTNGKMVTGDVEIDGKAYRFNEGGACTGEVPAEPEKPTEPEGNGWTQTDAGWTYIREDGTKAAGWLSVGGAWYYMNDAGIMQTGWVSAGGDWYYMDSSGAMTTGWISDGGAWYYMKPSGAMATGWISDSGSWYYFKSSGAMATGWISDGGSWYYFRSSGAMATGWLEDGGSWYYLEDSGALKTGWLKDSGKWYYFTGSGAMATGWQKVSGSWYYFKSGGAMQTGWFEDKEAEAKLPADQKRAIWYWFDNGGAMATGWKEIDGQWEMFDDSGEWLYTWQGN